MNISLNFDTISLAVRFYGGQAFRLLAALIECSRASRVQWFTSEILFILQEIQSITFYPLGSKAMGNQGGRGGGGGRDYSNQGSFGKAFHKAHSETGPGSTFNYNGKSYTTECKDGGNYRTQPIEHVYTKSGTTGTFNTLDRSYDARSGIHQFETIKYGSIPQGSYNVSNTSNTGGILRYNLTPNQDIGSRSHLQIHQKSQNILKNLTGLDTKGCISVDKEAIKNVKTGDTITVKKK